MVGMEEEDTCDVCLQNMSRYLLFIVHYRNLVLLSNLFIVIVADLLF